jgi:hypothetical protein
MIVTHSASLQICFKCLSVHAVDTRNIHEIPGTAFAFYIGFRKTLALLSLCSFPLF